MLLRDAARYFDKQVCADAFDEDVTFKAQLDLFDDSKRDGATGQRRVLSVADDVVLPASGAITLGTHVFIVGADHEDVFAGSVVRRKYVIAQADAAAEIRTLAQAALNTAGVATYANKVWVKDLKEVEQTSFMFPFFNVLLPKSTTVAKSQTILIEGILYFVRSVFISAGGFLTCECNQLVDTLPVTVTYVDRSGQGYSSALDKMVSAASVAAAALIMRYEDYYQKLSTEAPKNMPGDVCLAVPKATIVTPGAGDEWTTAAGVKYRVLTVADDTATSWLLQSRRA